MDTVGIRFSGFGLEAITTGNRNAPRPDISSVPAALNTRVSRRHDRRESPVPAGSTTFPEVGMSVHAALARPVLGAPRGRHAKPRATWPRVVARSSFLTLALISAGVVVGAGWPPILLVVPVAILLLLVAGVTKLRTASRKIDTIFAEELAVPVARETGIENVENAAA